MPTINATSIPTAVPTVEPSLSAGQPFQNIQASAGAFGGAAAQGLGELGQAFGQAGNELAAEALHRQQLFNQVAADDATNKYMDAETKLLYGDPDKPGDVGFFGAKGEDAMRMLPQVRDQLLKLRGDLRNGLQNPRQQLQFDTETRRMQALTLARMGEHYDRQFATYSAHVGAAQVQNGTTMLGQALAEDNSEAATTAVRMQMQGVMKQLAARGEANNPDIVNAELQKIRGGYTKMRVESIAEKNAFAALKYLEQNSDAIAGDEYNQLHQKYSAQASAIQAQIDAGLIPAQAGSADFKPMALGGAIPTKLKQAAQATGLPESLVLASADIESSMGQSPDRAGSRYKGILQLGPDEWAEMGGGNRDDVNLQIDHGVRLLAKRKQQLAERLGREPANWEVYLAHNQGVAGAAALLLHPEQPAGAVVTAVGGSPANISSNFKGDPSAPASRFTDAVRRAVQRREADPALHTGGSREVPVATTEVNTAAPPPITTTDAGLAGGPGPASIVSNTDGQPGPPIISVAQTGDTLITPKPLPKLDFVPPPLELGELPDAQVPGMAEKYEEIMRNVPPDEVKRRMNAVKAARQDLNQKYLERQRALREHNELVKQQSEKRFDQFTSKIYPGSQELPTPEQIAKDEYMTGEKKQTLQGFLNRTLTQPELPPSRDKANTVALFAGMNAPYESGERITTEAPFEQAFIHGQISKSSYDWLVKEFRGQRGTGNETLKEKKKELLDAVKPLIIGPKLGEGSELMDPEGSTRYFNYINYMNSKIDQYQKEGKNPLDLFNSKSPDFLGDREALKKSGYIAPIFNRVTNGAEAALPPVDLTAMSEEQLKAFGRANPKNYDAALQEAIRRGLVVPPQPALAPPAR